jgi:hypothetical protein
MNLRVKNVETSSDGGGAEGMEVDEAGDVPDAEEQSLLSEKGRKNQLECCSSRLTGSTDQYPADHFTKPPHFYGITTSDEASGILPSPVGDNTLLEAASLGAPFTIPFTIAIPRQSGYTCNIRVEVTRNGMQVCNADLDLERNKPETPQERTSFGRVVTSQRRTSSASLFGIGLSYSEVLDDARRALIENIWNNVKPWELSMLEPLYDEPLDPIGLVSHCRSTMEVFRLFTTSRLKESIKHAVVDASILIWHVERACQVKDDAHIMWGIIICCCLAAHRGKVTIGNILMHCYRIGVISQPKGIELKDYLEHILKVIECALSMNRVTQLEPLIMYEENGWKLEQCGRRRVEELLTTKMSLQEVLGIDLVELFQMLHMLKNEPHRLETASGLSFRADDLNIKSLKSVGRLDIQWTAIIENHLLLDLEEMTLSIAWSALPQKNSPVGEWQSQ